MFNAGSRVAVCFLYRKLMLFLDKIGFVNIIYIEKIQKGDRQLWT